MGNSSGIVNSLSIISGQWAYGKQNCAFWKVNHTKVTSV